MPRTWIPALIALAATACGGARGGATPWTSELGGETIDLWVEAGRSQLPMYVLEGRHHLLGEEGLAYAIGLRNRTDARLEVVVSVDGRDVITGQVADYRTNRGYVMEPGEEILVEGFRRSLEEVAAFEFSAPEESYAARLGDATNVGVIGAAVFLEAAPRPDQVLAGERELRRAEGAPAASPEAADEAAEPGLGTRYGDDVSSTAEIVPFVRADQARPAELVALYYDDRAGLEALGVVFPAEGPTPAPAGGPNPFPGVTPEDEGFAPPPPPR